MVICLEQGADLHMAQPMPLPLTVSCFSKIQIDFTFLVPAYPGSPGKGTVKCVSVFLYNELDSTTQYTDHLTGIIKSNVSKQVSTISQNKNLCKYVTKSTLNHIWQHT